MDTPQRPQTTFRPKEERADTKEGNIPPRLYAPKKKEVTQTS